MTLAWVFVTVTGFQVRVLFGPCAPGGLVFTIKMLQKKNIPGDSEARGGVRFSQALPAALVKFKRLGWQTARFLTLALGSSLWLMDYRSEPGRLTVILAHFLKGALIYYEEKESFGLWRTCTYPANERSMKLSTDTIFTLRASGFKDCVEVFLFNGNVLFLKVLTQSLVD